MSNFAKSAVAGTGIRVALFAAAASLAGYIVYKYSTQLHATQGFYGFLFPLSSVLAATGMLVAWRPRKACDCSAGVRAGMGLLAGLWLIAGLACVPSLAAAVANDPVAGLFATFHMFVQHVFLSVAVIAFAWAPRPMATFLGATDAPDFPPNAAAARGALSGR